MEEPASRAEALVSRARRRATVHGALRAAQSGLALAALVAAVILGVCRLFGLDAGFWPFLGVVAGLPFVLLRLRGARPSPTAAALLLDRASGTDERFLAAVTTADPEVRDYVARQALDRSTAGALRFPPSPEGLAAVLAVALLAGMFLLGPATDGTGPDPDTARVPGPSEPADPGPNAAPTEPPPEGAPVSPGAPVVTRIEGGEDLTEGDWKELSAAGLTEREREAIRAALAKGDRDGAAEAARAALRRAAADVAEPGVAGPGVWGDFERALESPVWPARFDRVVSEYFRASRQRGLR